MFTDEEIKTAMKVRDTIISENVDELKSIYMAGEIVMWAEMQAKNISINPPVIRRLPTTEEVKRWYQILVGRGEDGMKQNIEATFA